MKYKKTITRQMLDEAKEFFSKYENNVTRRAFVSNYKKYIDYCRREHNAKSKADLANHIQDYADHLVSRGLTPSTIHSYLAPVGLYHSVSLKEIRKPKRITAHYIRGRKNNEKNERGEKELYNPKFQRIVDFQACVGIRRLHVASTFDILDRHTTDLLKLENHFPINEPESDEFGQ